MAKIYLFFDTETTGLHNAHIISIAAKLVRQKDRRTLSQFDVLIENDKRESGEKALEIHGINEEMGFQVGISIRVALALFQSFRLKADVLVAHNFKFDARQIREEFERLDATSDIESAEHKCTMTHFTPFFGLGKANGSGFKNPKLGEAYSHFFSGSYSNAHTAMGDTIATEAIFWALVDAGQVP